MTVSALLRQDVANMDRSIERLTADIEEAEKRIVGLRQSRDDVRFQRAEAAAAAHFLDNAGFRVERDAAGVVTVSVDPPPEVPR